MLGPEAGSPDISMSESTFAPCGFSRRGTPRLPITLSSLFHFPPTLCSVKVQGGKVNEEEEEWTWVPGRGMATNDGLPELRQL